MVISFIVIVVQWCAKRDYIFLSSQTRPINIIEIVAHRKLPIRCLEEFCNSRTANIVANQVESLMSISAMRWVIAREIDAQSQTLYGVDKGGASGPSRLTMCDWGGAIAP